MKGYPHRLRVPTVALLAATLTSLPRADDTSPMPRPEVNVGDCWTFNSTNVLNRGPVGEYESCVTLVKEDLIFTVAKRKSDGREFDLAYTSEWGVSGSITGSVSTPPIRFLQFPLFIGKTYSNEYETHSFEPQEYQSKTKLECNVNGWDDVSVPAGKFHALKINCAGTYVGTGRSTGWGRVSGTFWYAPEVKRYVKWRYGNVNAEPRGDELVSFHLAKAGEIAQPAPTGKNGSTPVGRGAAGVREGSIDFVAEARKSARILGCPTDDVQLKGAENSELIFLARCPTGQDLTLACEPGGTCLKR